MQQRSQSHGKSRDEVLRRNYEAGPYVRRQDERNRNLAGGTEKRVYPDSK